MHVEAMERHRAHALAEVILKPARRVARRRRRLSRHRLFWPCLRDSVQACARAAGLPHVVRDVSVVPHDCTCQFVWIEATHT